MRKLGKKQLTVHLREPLTALPTGLAADASLSLINDGADLVYTFDAQADDTGIADLLRRLSENGVDFKDLKTDQSSLEDIFVSLVRAPQ
jgi:ABC-2 type transport system ATP-binding protein